jgi:hypothetical protein
MEGHPRQTAGGPEPPHAAGLDVLLHQQLTGRRYREELDVGLDIIVTAPGRPPAHRALAQLEPGENAVVFGLY